MSDFRWIALALTVTAGCQVYDRVPWRRGWGWLTAKALALRSWVFDDGYDAAGYSGTARDGEEWGDEPLVIDVSDIEEVEFPLSALSSAETTTSPGYTHHFVEDEPFKTAPKPRRRPSRAEHREGCPRTEFGICSCASTSDDPSYPRRRAQPIAGPPPRDPDATEVEALPLVRRRPSRKKKGK